MTDHGETGPDDTQARYRHLASPTAVREKQLGALTSLRFFAAAMIVVVHSYAYFQMAPVNDLLQLTQGVSFFFVLSGFILAYTYDQPRTVSWREFYAARVARIWPAHIAVLALYFMLIDNPFGNLPQGGTRAAVLASNALLLHAWLPLQAFFFSFNPVSWSLSTEVAFYLLFPLLIRRKPGSLPWPALSIGFAIAAAFVVAGLSLDIRLFGAPFEPSLLGLILVNPLPRLFEFTLGIFGCAIFRRLGERGPMPWQWLELGALMLAVLSMCACTEARLRWLPAALGYYFVWSGSAPAFAVLIMVFAMSRGPLTRLMSARPLRFLGEISFCLYLVHFPILNWIAAHRALPSEEPLGVVAYWLACLIASSFLFLLVERPARGWLIHRLRRYRAVQ